MVPWASSRYRTGGPQARRGLGSDESGVKEVEGVGDGEEAGAGGFLTGVLLHGIADLAQLSRQSLLLAILQSLLRSVFKLMKLGRYLSLTKL